MLIFMFLKNAKDLLENARRDKLLTARKILLEMMENALSSADPKSVIKRYVRIDDGYLKIGEIELKMKEIGNIIVVGGGKASGAMAEALEDLLGDKITKGIVSVPRGTASKHHLNKIDFVEAGHPLPDEGGKVAAERVLSAVSVLKPNDLVICLISGGGSALLTLPVEGVMLEEIKKTTEILLKSGANIQEFNTVRKHLSQIKGGQLAKAAYPAKIVTLLISDVVGDVLSTIASGPTEPDPTTFSDALAVLKKYELVEKVPKSVLKHLRNGSRGMANETPKSGERCFQNTYSKIVASNADALNAAAEVGRNSGLKVSILTQPMQGEAKKFGEYLASLAKQMIERWDTGALLLLGGECTVTVKGAGLGGRSQEIVLSASLGITELEDVAVIAFSTDGIEGSTDAAGAIADSLTIDRASKLGLDPRKYLERNDSYSFFKRLNDLLITGPTMTNVMDIAGLILL